MKLDEIRRNLEKAAVDAQRNGNSDSLAIDIDLANRLLMVAEAAKAVFGAEHMKPGEISRGCERIDAALAALEAP